MGHELNLCYKMSTIVFVLVGLVMNRSYHQTTLSHHLMFVKAVEWELFALFIFVCLRAWVCVYMCAWVCVRVSE